MVVGAAGAKKEDAELACGDGEVFVEALADGVVEPAASSDAGEDAVYVDRVIGMTHARIVSARAEFGAGMWSGKLRQGRNGNLASG